MHIITIVKEKINFFYITATIALFSVLPFLASAQGGLGSGDAQAGKVGDYIKSIIEFIQNAIFPLLLAIAFIFFVWGVIQFFVIGGSNDDAKAKGKSLIIYAIVGFVIIFSFYGLIGLLVGGLDLDDANIDTGIPELPNIR